MDKDVAFLLCVLYIALSHVPITNAEWKGNVCNTTKTEYLKESYCVRHILFACTGHKTKLTSRISYHKSCCPGWSHNGDQNCNIPICSPVCQKDATCVAPNKCECTLDQADTNRASAIDNDDCGRNSSTDMTEKNPPLTDNDDLGRNSTTSVTDRKPPLSDTISALFLTYILPGTAVILTCVNCGIFAYKSRKRFCKRRNIISITAGDILSGADPANSYEIEMMDSDINPVTSYCTIGEDNTVGPRTIEDNTGAPKSPDLGSKSRQIKRNNPPDKPKEICLQSYEDAYLHPI